MKAMGHKDDPLIVIPVLTNNDRIKDTREGFHLLETAPPPDKLNEGWEQ
jgi:hypothetical protein